jgi:hypothetical protein
MQPSVTFTYCISVVAGLYLTGLVFCLARGFAFLLCFPLPVSRICLRIASKNEQSGAQNDEQFPHVLPPRILSQKAQGKTSDSSDIVADGIDVEWTTQLSSKRVSATEPKLTP